MIGRSLTGQIVESLSSGKAVILLGARQTGKTTLLREVCSGYSDSVLWLNGDELDVQALFARISSERIKALLGTKKILVIDEAQRITDIGVRLKLVTDSLPDIRLIATGSSSFELANRINEPLTGRKKEYKLFPLSFGELVADSNLLTQKRLLPVRLMYGSYPEVVTSAGNEKNILRELTQSYVYKDILSFERIRNSEKLIRLLQALAWQIGSQVSFNELARTCGLDAKTVDRYIRLLEQAYIVFRLGTYSRNLRNELKTSRKIYFWDTGIRNALIANFAEIENRSDAGALWENYLVAERLKRNAYDHDWANSYFWRTKEGQEIDYLEESDGRLAAWEIKWSAAAGTKAKAPLSFRNAYPETRFAVVSPENVEDFLL